MNGILPIQYEQKDLIISLFNNYHASKPFSPKNIFINGMFPPATAAKVLLFSIDDNDGNRPLERVANVPALRQDRTLLDAPGYDKVSRLFYHPTGHYPSYP
ncbi:MAG: hypothetical protein LBJ36_07505 [Synergistaceae bacterium]|nr:hypothetical protein [Synergistaceae bacterium]